MFFCPGGLHDPSPGFHWQRLQNPGLRSKRFEQLGYVLGRLHLFQDGLYLPVRANEVGGPFSGPLLFIPDLIRFYHLLIRVAQQGKGKTMFVDEILVTLNAIDADAEELHFGLEFTPGIAQVTGLGCATRGIVLRVKIQNQRGICEIGQLHLVATAVNASDRGRFKIRGRITNFKFCRHDRAGRKCHV